MCGSDSVQVSYCLFTIVYPVSILSLRIQLSGGRVGIQLSGGRVGIQLSGRRVGI